MNGVSERLRAVRQCFGMNQIEMSAHLGLGKNSWQRYEIEGKLPKGETLAKLAQAGFSGHWLLTGQGPMRTAEQAAFAASAPTPAAPAAIDAQLMGRIVDAVRGLYKAEGVGIADIQVGRLAAEWYNHVVAEAPDDLVGQGMALARKVEEHRAQLRRDAADPGNAKRQA